MALTGGMQLGRYEIVAPLGKGGMGEVYRAKDRQLGRDVAIKVLPEHLSEDPVACKRFEKEAKAVAALSHPNILEIYDTGTQEGIAYAVTELLEGETLRERMKSPIPPREAVEIATAVADGLAAAHAKGLIHRDLKPENIFILNDGRIKILDFGLARYMTLAAQSEESEVPTRSHQTQPGAVMGTLVYMSPEQVRGEPLDARSDIFSLACILHEMAVGKRPFSGGSQAETIAAILKEEPAGLTEVSPDLRRIIERCLQKKPEQRFHSAHDLAFALRDIQSKTATAPPPNLHASRFRARSAWIAGIVLTIVAAAILWKVTGFRTKSREELSHPKILSLAVLPLDNLSGDSKQEYFADGMTEELIAKLARIASLRVISRTSVMEYKNARKPLPQIAKELNVDAIVEGSVLQAGDRVRITTQLIHAATDHHLWAQSYERDLKDILALQNEVASAIAREIQITLAPGEAAQLAGAPIVNPEAYQAYLRGLNYAESMITDENLRLAVDMFQKAVDLDPQYAIAYAELSRAESLLYFTVDPSAARLEKVKAALDRAFELQPGLPEGHIARGYYYYRGFRDYDRALEEWAIAKKSLPNSNAILEGESTVHRRRGNFNEAIQTGQKLVSMNPRNAQTNFDLGVSYSLIRNYSEAQRYFDLATSLSPEGFHVSSALNHLFWKGDIKAARAIMDQAPQSSYTVYGRLTVELFDRKYQSALDVLSGPTAHPIRKHIARGMVYGYVKDFESARNSYDVAARLLEDELRKKPDEYEVHGMLGIVYAGLGRKEDAIREGKRGVEILPVSKDAIWGPYAIENLAVIYVMTDQPELAVDQLEYLMSIPSQMSVSRLRLEPRWDPLRLNPRFQKLLEN